MSGAADPWAEFRAPATAPVADADPWAEFRAAAPDAPTAAPASAPAAPAGPGLGRQILDAARSGLAGGMTFGLMRDPVDARNIERGITMGYGDEARAAARATVGGIAPRGRTLSDLITGANPASWSGRYDAALADERAQDRAAESNPVRAAVGQVIGGAMVPLGSAGSAVSLGSAMLRGGATGAAVGGVSGFGEGQGGFEPRLRAAQFGAGVGGALGTALPPAMLGGLAAGRAIAPRLGLDSADAPAQRLMLRDLGRGPVTLDELATSSAAAGNTPTALVDLAGENVLGAAQAIARMPGPGREMAAALVRGRSGPEQRARIEASIRRHVSGDDYASTADDLITRRSAEAAPLYDRAYAVELPRDLRLQRFLNDPDVAAGVRRGVDLERRAALAEDRAFDLSALGVRFADDGSIQLVRDGMPTRLFDIAKRGLDDMIEARTDAVTRRVDGEGRSLVQIRGAMLNRLDELNPDYAAARASYAGPSRLLDAMAAGRRFLSEGDEAAEWSARRIAALPPAEREAVRAGAARALLDKAARATDQQDQTRLNNIFMRPHVRERIRATFDDDASFLAFARDMDAEVGRTRVDRAISPQAGSQTMPLQERRADLANPPSGPTGVVDADRAQTAFDGRGWFADMAMLARGGGGNLAGIGIRSVERLRDASRGRALERNAAEYGRMIFNPDEQARQAAVQALIQRALRDQATGGLLAPVNSGLLRGGAVGGGLLSN